jgi:hypothetical protein
MDNWLKDIIRSASRKTFSVSKDSKIFKTSVEKKLTKEEVKLIKEETDKQNKLRRKFDFQKLIK